VRLRAAQWLCAEAERREKLEGDRPRDQRNEIRRDEVIAELRGLYQRAFPNPTDEPLVEAVNHATAAGEPEEAPGGARLEWSVESLAREEHVSLNPATAEGAEDAKAPTTAPAPIQPNMVRVSPPGYFPPKFRRVPAP
jgi:hypothetical protein